LFPLAFLPGIPKLAKRYRKGYLGQVTASGLPTSPDDDIRWLSTADAADRLGITPRTLYRFIDEGQVAAYRFGRVIRLKATDVDGFIDNCRIEPGTLEHLYPDSGTQTSTSETSITESSGT